MTTAVPNPTSSRLRRVGALFAVLFCMSGADGQNAVQLMFLLSTAASLVLAEYWPALQSWWRAQVMRHPQGYRELNLWLGRWGIGL